jgi:peptidoglycan hydrolase-like protein with peptidoglycan-binding domain
MERTMERQTQLAQKLLRERGLYRGAIDGVSGPLTRRGLAQVEGIDLDLPPDRQIATLIQISAQERGIGIGPIDGLWGPRTDRAVQELLDRGPEE